MTTEDKALALVNDCGGDVLVVVRNGNPWVEALCRAIEQHEAFRQEVSDAVMQAFPNTGLMPDCLGKIIIPAPKPDPLVEVLTEVDPGNGWDDEEDYARQIHKALEARGFEIRKKSK